MPKVGRSLQASGSFAPKKKELDHVRVARRKAVPDPHPAFRATLSRWERARDASGANRIHGQRSAPVLLRLRRSLAGDLVLDAGRHRNPLLAVLGIFLAELHAVGGR